MGAYRTFLIFIKMKGIKMSEQYPSYINEILANSQEVAFNFNYIINWEWEMLCLYGRSINKILLRHGTTKLLSYHDVPAAPARMVTLLNKAVTTSLTQAEQTELWDTLLPSLGVYSNGRSYYDIERFMYSDWSIVNQNYGFFVEPFTIEDGLAAMTTVTNKAILTERDKVITQFILSSPEVATYRTDLENLMTNQQKYVQFVTEEIINGPGIYSIDETPTIDTVVLETKLVETNSDFEVIENVNATEIKLCTLCNAETIQVSNQPTTDGKYRYKCTYADCGHYDYF